MNKLVAALLAGGILVGCDAEIATLPSPEKLTEFAVGNYCGMILTEHAGPKAQLFEKGQNDPLWFSAVRDALAYIRLPGEAQSVVAIYVHDMGNAQSWENPQTEGIWILAETAFYVINSSKQGGMGMIEVVPFGEREKAVKFAEEFGGQIVKYKEIPVENLFPDPDEKSVSAGPQRLEGSVQ
jgi:copper chaperone NosL